MKIRENKVDEAKADNDVCCVVYLSGTLEFARNFVRANIEKQAKRERNVEVDAQNVSFNGSAEADGGFKVCKALDERAARRDGWLPKSHVEQAVQHISAYP